MKKILATVASIAMVAACSTAAFAAGDIGKSETVTPGASSGNTNTGVVLTVVPVALAAGALTVSGIVFEKRQFFARFDLLTQNDNNLSFK